MEVEVTRLSSKGQLVVPLALRRRLKTTEGTRFLIFAQGDTIILKKLRSKATGSWEEQVRGIRKKARTLRLNREDVSREIKVTRNEH